MDWFEAEIQIHYDVTLRGRLGPGDADDKQATLLNHVISWTQNGIEIEADPRHAERLVRQLNVEGANPLSTPGVKAQAAEIETDEPVDEHKGRVFKAATARSNYMGDDRPECKFATKECCRHMASPTVVAHGALKRIGRFVEGHRRLVIKMP